jgi:excisionase family DNA binding protein
MRFSDTSFEMSLFYVLSTDIFFGVSSHSDGRKRKTQGVKMFSKSSEPGKERHFAHSPVLQKQFYSVKEFGAVYGFGTTSVYALLKAGALRAVKVGGLTKIRRDDAEAWAAGLVPRAA